MADAIGKNDLLVFLIITHVLSEVAPAAATIADAGISNNMFPGDDHFSRDELLTDLRLRVSKAITNLTESGKDGPTKFIFEGVGHAVNRTIVPGHPVNFKWTDSQILQLIKRLKCYRIFFGNLRAGFGNYRKTCFGRRHYIDQIDMATSHLSVLIDDEMEMARQKHMNRLRKPSRICKPFKKKRQEKRKQPHCKLTSDRNIKNQDCADIIMVYYLVREDYQHTLERIESDLDHTKDRMHKTRLLKKRQKWLNGHHKHTTRRCSSEKRKNRRTKT